MRLKIKQLRRIIQESILNGPYEPHVNQKKHAQAMSRLRRDAMDFASTAGPQNLMDRLQYKYPDFVDDCEARAEANGLVLDDSEDLFVQCVVDYCRDMSEKQINRFVASMHSPG